jgi:hypothetical protein
LESYFPVGRYEKSQHTRSFFLISSFSVFAHKALGITPKGFALLEKGRSEIEKPLLELKLSIKVSTEIEPRK